MKKNISINIGGIIFHIEEDGYDTLKRYLDSIKKYFSTFDDSSEILADIESRIAEIFLSKLNEGKQVITAEDVNALITTMGSVSDFKAAEAQELIDEPAATAEPAAASTGATQEQTADTASAGGSSSASSGSSSTGSAYAAPKQLSRDQKRKVLGGVCSGIANYLNVDAVWVRLFFALLAFAWGITIFAYIIMWILVPGSYELNEIEGNKKMFRDPERKVIGGVAGGVAAYLGIDILAVRILFIIFTVFGGLGLLVYIVLWVVIPEARSLTDRMQMQGEAVTLSNIESNIKKNQALGTEEETPITRIILFPFRLLGIILTSLGKVIVPLFEVFRVAIGVVIVLTGVGFILTAVLAGGTAIGITTTHGFPWADGNDVGFPLEAMTRAFPSWLAFVGFIAAIIPSIFLVLLGVSVIARKMVFNPTVGWSLVVVFFVCAVMLTVGISKAVYAFKEKGELKVENTFEPTGNRVIMKVNEVGLDDYNGASLTLKGYDGKNFKLVSIFTAQGNTRQKAIENASMVTYKVDQADSVFLFDSNITFNPDAIFRGQELNMTLYIPYNKPFVMESGFSRFITQWVDYEYIDDHTWIMSENKGLECTDCPDSNQSDDSGDHYDVAAGADGGDHDLRDFDELDLRGVFDVRIHRGDDYRVELDGSEDEKKKYTIYRAGETLVIDFEGKKSFNWDKVMNDEVRINITMPSLEKLDAIGYGTIHFDEFYATDMEMEIKGPIKVRGQLNAEDVVLNLSGKAEVDLSGRANKLSADLELASKLKAYNFEVNDAIVEAKGASSAKVNVTNSLEMEEGVASDIDYRGEPHVIKRDND